MPDNEQQQPIEWFLARNGQQTGPVQDHELQKIIELGHLRPTDLVWRHGFSDWMPAAKVFQLAPPPSAPSRPSPGGSSSPTGGATGQRSAGADHRSDIGVATREPRGSPNRGSQAGFAPGEALESTGDRSGPAGSLRAAPHGMSRDGQGQPYLGAQRHDPHAPAGQQRPNGADDPDWHQHNGTDTGDPYADMRLHADESEKRGVPWLKITAALLVAVVLGAGAAFWVKGRVSLSSITQLFQSFAGGPPPEASRPAVVRAPKDADRIASPTATAVVSTSPPPARPPTSAPGAAPPPSFAGGPSEIDTALQRLRLWQVVKQQFPDWYGERIKDAVRLRANQKDDAAIEAELTGALVKLRRDNANAALAASPAHLQAIATTFVDNLERLARHSTQACFGFISAGETEPMVLELMRTSEFANQLRAQLAAIFEAIADGRRTPKQHAPAVREDFDALAVQLNQRGWGPQDLQLFADARALSRAAPERVCRMVRDWFVGQLAIKDEAIQLRLLVETLKPVVAG